MSKKLRFSGLIEWQKIFLALASNIFEWKVKHLRVTGPAASWGLTCSCWCLAVAGAGGGGEAGPGLHRDLRWSPRPLPRPHPAPPGGSGSAWRGSCHSWTSGVTELSRGCGDNIHPCMETIFTPVPVLLAMQEQQCSICKHSPLFMDMANTFIWTIYPPVCWQWQCMDNISGQCHSRSLVERPQAFTISLRWRELRAGLYIQHWLWYISSSVLWHLVSTMPSK